MTLRSVPLPDAPERPGSQFDRAVKERFETALPMRLPSYTYQQLTALTPAAYEGVMVVCSNGDNGRPCLAFCTGTAWKRLAWGENISL
jgi:hypothetical protein